MHIERAYQKGSIYNWSVIILFPQTIERAYQKGSIYNEDALL